MKNLEGEPTYVMFLTYYMGDIVGQWEKDKIFNE